MAQATAAKPLPNCKKVRTFNSKKRTAFSSQVTEMAEYSKPSTQEIFMQRLSIILLLLLLFCTSACKNNNPQGRVAIRGNITLAGKPLAEGSIQFESQPGFQPSVITGGTIKQGDFSLSAADGLIPGQEYLVRIKSMEEVPGTREEKPADAMMSKVQYRDIVPPRYGKASTLTFTATEKSPNKFQIDMEL